MNDEQLEIVFQLFDQILHALFIRGVVDKKFLEYESIYGGGGARNLLLELKVADVIRLNNAIIGDISE